MIFAHGLGKITDMDVDPDGNLHVLSRYYNTPTIFRIYFLNETRLLAVDGSKQFYDCFGRDLEAQRSEYCGVTEAVV